MSETTKAFTAAADELEDNMELLASVVPALVRHLRDGGVAITNLSAAQVAADKIIAACNRVNIAVRKAQQS